MNDRSTYVKQRQITKYDPIFDAPIREGDEERDNEAQEEESVRGLQDPQ